MKFHERVVRLFRRSWRPLRIVLLAYLAALAVLIVFENSLFYRPAKASQYWVAPPSPEIVDLLLNTGEHSVHAWWWPRSGSKDVMLYCHGNASNLSRRGRVLSKFREALDANALIFDYPGYGKSGGFPSEAGCYAAAEAAYEWLVNEQRFDPNRIIIYGQSLGGGVAVELAQRKPHRVLVLVKTFTSAPAVAGRMFPWAPVSLLMHNRFDNLSRISNCTQPVFIAHATEDELIPFEHGRRLFQAANAPKSFCAVSGGHNDRVPDELIHQMRDFLEAH